MDDEHGPDEHRPDEQGTPESLDPLARTNRYAVPVSTLVGGVYVAADDQVTLHPDPPADVSFGAGGAWGDDGD